MTNPNDPWSRRPESGSVDGPTERVSPSSGSSEHTSEFGDAYGPTETFGQAGGPHEQTTAYDYFGQPPGPDATRVMPPHDAHWGGYESGAPTGYPPTAAYGTSGYPGPPPGGPGYQTAGSGYQTSPGGPGGPVPPGGYPPGYPEQPGPPGPQRKTGMWIAIGLGALALVAIAGVLVGTLLADRDSSNSAAATSTQSTQAQLPTGTSRTSAQPLPSGVPQIPGLGDIDELGATMGTVASNDGATLTVETLSGTTVTVHTNEQTQVISLGSTTVEDLPVGEMVMIQGDKASDGSVTAKIIISTMLPGGTR
ncbi:hypothetical protein HLB23_37505 [Nocardia uniformis]|uniref:DUF5666 domain-containing protein n=1 Tax=Nocardia uniformis TaxID=53432 RepID=A0A849CAC2_9NOCA|nr:DUF5666 domain-containing protein [Nocardia uniformis]NNH75482.1 hypothetical protein [Nocardia uniformis]